MKVNPYLKNLVCLYVEDEEFIRDSFSLMLKRYFKEVIIAKNGKEGLENFKNNEIDIIISDIRMPIMDGIEMVKQIKEINPKVYVIFITAFSDTEYLKAAIDLNVEGYLTKPIDRNILIKKLNFLSDVIKNEKETKELLELLKIIFERQDDGIILYEDKEAKLCNKEFLNVFKKCFSLEELINLFKIDVNKNLQTINVNDRVYEVKINKLSNKYLLIYFDDVTSYKIESFIDELTQVYNRKYLNEILKELIKRKKLCLIELDIDHFKKVNDTYGHPFGDEVLKKIASILKSKLRKNDLIIRMGGEEFLIILDNDEIDNALMIAEKLRKAIEEEDFEKTKVTSSFGVCCGDINSKDDFEKLYSLVDEALYKAKQNGRNRVESCN